MMKAEKDEKKKKKDGKWWWWLQNIELWREGRRMYKAELQEAEHRKLRKQISL